MESKVYCIIVTYNGMQWIEECLQSLSTSNYPLEVLVIDNASTDDTCKLIENKFKNIRLERMNSNLGFGQANNYGIKIALHEEAEYIFLLNQDTKIFPETIVHLYNAAIQNPEYGILSPFHLDTSEKKLESQFVSYLANAHEGDLFSDLYFKRLALVYETNYIHAASWFMSRNCVSTVGGFSPLFFHYGEDDDYLQRARHFKFKIGLVPAAFIVHDNDHKSWERLEWDENRNKISAYQKLNKMSPHFRSNFLVYLKSTFDELTSLLVFRKFRKFFFMCGISFQVLRKMKKISRLNRQSFKNGAFLK